MLEVAERIITTCRVDTLLARELTNGTWFFINVYVLCYLFRLVYYKMDRPIWRQPDWIKLCWGLSLIMAGSLVRAGWIWLYLLSDARGWTKLHQALGSVSDITMFAVGFGLWGAVCVSKLFQSSRRSAFRQVLHVFAVVLVSISVPLIAHYIVRF